MMSEFMHTMTVDASGMPTIGLLHIPTPNDEEVLVEAIAVGLCGTDREIIEQKTVKQGMILGHESLGRVIKAPVNSGFVEGELVVGYIRRSCEEKCNRCKHEEFERCESSNPMERGIMGLNGFGADYWVSEPQYLIKGNPQLGILNILVEPLSSIMRGLRRINLDGELPNDALIVGAGPIGLLAATILKQKGVRNVVINDNNWNTKKLDLARKLDVEISYHISQNSSKYKLVLDAAGTKEAFLACLDSIGKNGRFLVLGICHSVCAPRITPANHVFGNTEIVFSVNATKSDYSSCVKALSDMDKSYLELFITQETTPGSWWPDFHSHQGVKSIVRFANI